MLDRKTGGFVRLLFTHQGRRVSPTCLNEVVIPALCVKAGVPAEDVRGSITSHRARSTIASQLYNAKEGMSLEQLKDWLGHASIKNTQAYTAISPTKLAKAYSDAGYFERNARTISVLLDREVIESGAASTGTPYMYYDLGHGYCKNAFFAQCPHRMVCAKCSFYAPKESSLVQILEAKQNIERFAKSIPLQDDELAAIDGDQAALDGLCKRLADVPTPVGTSPRQLVDGLPFVPLLSLTPHHDQRPQLSEANAKSPEDIQPDKLELDSPAPPLPRRSLHLLDQPREEAPKSPRSPRKAPRLAAIA